MTPDALAIVDAWQDAVNRQDGDAVVALSHPETSNKGTAAQPRCMLCGVVRLFAVCLFFPYVAAAHWDAVFT
ncbi:hypothetical protein HC891_14515 [Candidatus Gracilibacteria bacterium]|nr:hypothetical protein [Candidatus Gracilibacteria bacterium]